MAGARFNYVWLTPLLERPRLEVEADIQAALDRLSLKERLDVSEISLRDVISTALNMSGYYANLAAEWFESGFPLDEGLVKQIDAGINSKQWEQQTRHRLYRLARRFDRT